MLVLIVSLIGPVLPPHAIVAQDSEPIATFPVEDPLPEPDYVLLEASSEPSQVEGEVAAEQTDDGFSQSELEAIVEPAPSPLIDGWLQTEPPVVRVGDTFTVTALLSNRGNLDANALQLRLPLPAGTELVSSTFK
ncbi:DUF11 domain-containing protein [Candidatus Gracilibacteria bacterium]|nr:DUF11 domain-containing protein [Candidatus Gracilibacteria bacterium]